jgi:hypothetical protein
MIRLSWALASAEANQTIDRPSDDHRVEEVGAQLSSHLVGHHPRGADPAGQQDVRAHRCVGQVSTGYSITNFTIPT